MLKSQQTFLEKVSIDLESLEFYNFFGVHLTLFDKYQILLNKISHRFLLTTKLYASERSSLDIYDLKQK